MGSIFMNLSANMLGLDNAATPMYSCKYPIHSGSRAERNHRHPQIPAICLWLWQVRNYGHNRLLCIADNALSRMAEALAKDAEVKGQKEKARRYKEDARLFYNRSLGYKHYYSKEYGTFRPILPNGEFYAPFDPRQGENEPSRPVQRFQVPFYTHEFVGFVTPVG